MKGRTVLVTGASSGIGRAAAERLAADGWRVAGSVRGAAAADALRARGIAPVELDVTDPSDRAALPERLAAAFEASAGRGMQTAEGLDRPRVSVPLVLDALVGNAGVVEPGPLEHVALDALRRQLEVNVVGALGVVQTLMPALRRAASARIVFVGSISGRVAFPFMGAYNASKFALGGLADTLRLELADSGIEVAVIEPGSVRTPLQARTALRWKAVEAACPAVDEHYGARLAQWERELAAGRGLDPARVAQAIAHALGARRMRARIPVGLSALKWALAARFAPRRWLERRLLGAPAPGEAAPASARAEYREP